MVVNPPICTHEQESCENTTERAALVRTLSASQALSIASGHAGGADHRWERLEPGGAKADLARHRRVHPGEFRSQHGHLAVRGGGLLGVCSFLRAKRSADMGFRTSGEGSANAPGGEDLRAIVRVG